MILVETLKNPTEYCLLFLTLKRLACCTEEARLIPACGPVLGAGPAEVEGCCCPGCAGVGGGWLGNGFGGCQNGNIPGKTPFMKGFGRPA